MLLDPLEQRAVSSLGWVEHGGIWMLDIQSGEVRVEALGEAKYLTLCAGRERLFSVIQNFNDGRVHITAHSFADPPSVLGRCIVEPDRCEVEGALDPWTYLPRHYVAYLERAAWKDFGLISVGRDGSVSAAPFDLYDDSYDKGYQGIIGAVASPTSDELLVSVQRSSSIVICTSEGHKTGHFDLAKSHGNPKLVFRGVKELWADDYDTLLVLDSRNWRVCRSRKLQDASSGTAQFIGQFAFTRDESYCAVARPFSGDVLVLDPDTLKTRFRAKLGGQPLEVAILHDRRVFARDWKTGALLHGVAQRAWFA